MNIEPLVSLFGGYYAGAAATSAYERRWNSPLVFHLVPCFVFFDILCVSLIAAHIALVRLCTDIVLLGANITSPTVLGVRMTGVMQLLMRHFDKFTLVYGPRDVEYLVYNSMWHKAKELRLATTYMTS